MSRLNPVEAMLARRRLGSLAILAALVLLGAGSSAITRFSLAEGLASFPKAFAWMSANFIPDARALRNLPKICARLGDTVLLSVMASACSAAVAFCLAILASRTSRPHPAVSAAVRLLASVCRNVPIVAWAMIFLVSFGQNAISGFLALFIGSLGYLTRAFTETIDEAAGSPMEALRASGAGWLQTVSQALVPSVVPQAVSWILYMIETNIRDATLVGILTGTGIGFLFDLYYKSLSYPSASMVVILIVVAVILVELVSNALRRVIA